MTRRRVYSKKRVFELFREAGVHGNYATLLWREGIKPLPAPTPDSGVFYDAEVIDQLIKDIKA